MSNSYNQRHLIWVLLKIFWPAKNVAEQLKNLPQKKACPSHKREQNLPLNAHETNPIPPDNFPNLLFHEYIDATTCVAPQITHFVEAF